jgi:hypothetical protein
MTNIVDQRCSNHAMREAAVQCPSCKRFFCRECVTEHQGRMICVSCVTTQIAAQPRARFRARWTIMAAAGILLAWLLFYYLGLTLSRIPSEFHAEPEARFGVWTALDESPRLETEPRPAGAVSAPGFTQVAERNPKLTHGAT